MEEYPEELRTPPVALVCLAGCPELHHAISAFLHSEQPPINTLALPDFSKSSVLARKKNRDPLSPPNPSPPAGILKRDWLLKHRTRVPAVVAAIFRAEQISGDPAHWLQACTDLENLKSSLQGRSTRLVVILVQTQVGEEPGEDMIIALRKRAEIDSKQLLLFNQNDAFESGLSLNRVASLFAELCLTYYKEEGRRIRSGIEKKSSPFPELNIRYCFKVAIYAEFRRDWAEALKFYEEGYRVLHEMINNTTNRLPPVQRLVEIKTISEYLHFKISTLLLHGGKIPEAIARFRKHVKSHKRLVGTPDADFLHWDWYSRQFLVFAELLETSSGSGTGPSEKLTLTEWEFQPAYYYQMAADYMREKRCCLERSSESKSELSNKAADAPESVMPSIYAGQSARLFEEGDSVTVLPLSDAEYVAYSLAEAERFQDSYEIIALYRKAHELFTSRGSTRFANQCNIGMAKEYHASEDFFNAKQLFDSVATLYRNEGWPVLLFEILGFLRDCARKLGLGQEFVAYSLEMCALPLGQSMVSKREEIQREIIELNEGPIRVEIDLVSPLRTVFNACVAFHEESVKPGGAASLTVSVLTQLPSRVEIDSLQVEFNKEECNFVVLEKLEVSPNKWMRLTKEIMPGQSGKLECLSVTAKIGKNLTISCRAESASSTEESHMWKFENPPDSSPAGDPILSFCGQKLIQVEEPDSSVELVLCSAGPALVGEIFQIPVKVISNNHLIKSGELKINLVDARGGGLLMSPRETETDEIEMHHVELLSISSPQEDEKSDDPSDPFGGIESGENIKKIQYSFGVVSVPELKKNQSWSCNLEVKWHRAKTVMLYVSLGYLGNTDQRVNIHKSLQIEGKIPVLISHRYMTAFRKEPLLISNIRSLSPPIEDLKDTLALNEDNILVINTKNCTEVPLKLVGLTIELENGEKSSEFFSVREISGISDDRTSFVPDEEFRAVFSVIPLVPNPNLSIGTVCLKWIREGLESAQTVITNHSLPRVTVEEPPLVATIECPPFATLGSPFSLYVKIKNKTNLLQEIKYNLGDSQNFVFSGGHVDSFSVLPKNEHVLSYKFVALASGIQILPKITVLSVRYSAQFNPSVASSTIFVYPSEPKLGLEENKAEIVA
ncbi:hypothetical protein LUZ60_000066 [Juncus effusus]|nr:hypothetical protein LUZ60_000066 [Juncus effusus]